MNTDRRSFLSSMVALPVLGAAAVGTPPKIWHRRMPDGEGYRTAAFVNGERVWHVSLACPAEGWLEVASFPGGKMRLADWKEQTVDLPQHTVRREDVYIDEEKLRLYVRYFMAYELRDLGSGEVVAVSSGRR